MQFKVRWLEVVTFLLRNDGNGMGLVSSLVDPSIRMICEDRKRKKTFVVLEGTFSTKVRR